MIVCYKHTMVEYAHLSLGERIQFHRIRLGKKQWELALDAGTSQSAISHLEAGQRDNLYLSTLMRIAASLGVTVGQLVD